MPQYEYLLLTLERAAKFEYTCDGETYTGDDTETARRHFRSLLTADGGARLDEHRRHILERRAFTEGVFLDWTKRCDALREQFHVESVEVEIEKGKYAMRDRVTAPDGSVRMLDPGSGRDHVDATIRSQVGEPPPEPGAAPDVSDDAISDHLLSEMQSRRVDLWSATLAPSGAALVHGEWAHDLATAAATELNHLGAQGWQVVDVHEDRGIAGGVSGTATMTVAARYTLMRKLPGEG